MGDRLARSARKPSRWVLAGLVAFAVSVYLMTILSHVRGAGGG